MELNEQQLREKVKEAMLEILAENAPVPAAQPASASGGPSTTEVRVSPSGEVTVRVTPTGAAMAVPVAVGCYDFAQSLNTMGGDPACYSVEQGPPLQGLTFSATEEAQIARVLESTGLSREALLRRLVERVVASEIGRFAGDIGLGG